MAFCLCLLLAVREAATSDMPVPVLMSVGNWCGREAGRGETVASTSGDHPAHAAPGKPGALALLIPTLPLMLPGCARRLLILSCIFYLLSPCPSLYCRTGLGPPSMCSVAPNRLSLLGASPSLSSESLGRVSGLSLSSESRDSAGIAVSRRRVRRCCATKR